MYHTINAAVPPEAAFKFDSEIERRRARNFEVLRRLRIDLFALNTNDVTECVAKEKRITLKMLKAARVKQRIKEDAKLGRHNPLPVEPTEAVEAAEQRVAPDVPSKDEVKAFPERLTGWQIELGPIASPVRDCSGRIHTVDATYCGKVTCCLLMLRP